MKHDGRATARALAQTANRMRFMCSRCEACNNTVFCSRACEHTGNARCLTRHELGLLETACTVGGRMGVGFVLGVNGTWRVLQEWWVAPKQLIML